MAYMRREWKCPDGTTRWEKKEPDGGGRPTGRVRVQIALGRNPETGKTRWETKTFASAAEAKKWGKELDVKRDKGEVRPTVSTATLAGYLRDTWLPFYATQVRSTYTAEKVLAKWIINHQPGTPALGRIALRKLTPKDFTKLYVSLADVTRTPKPLQRRAIEHLHRLLHCALRHAMEQGELTTNPTDYAKLPKLDPRRKEIRSAEDEEESKVEYLEPEQAKRFHDAALADRWKPLWLLLLDAGLRPGEAFALKWRHIDWDQNMVKVRGSLTRIRNEKRKERGQGWIVTKPKTEESNREVPLRSETMDALKEWKKEQAKQRLCAGTEWRTVKQDEQDARDEDFVFTTETGNPLGNNLRHAWEQVMRKADGGRGDLGTWKPARERKVVQRQTKRGGRSAKCSSGPAPQPVFVPRYSPYVLRHTSATLLVRGGMDLLHVARRLGHSKNSTTAMRVYVHVQAKDSTGAPAILDRLFGT